MADAPFSRINAADAAGISKAIRVLEAGGLVAVPTETVYGLAARADSPEAVARIYAAKGRPDFNPLIVHVRDVAHAKVFAEWDARAEALAAHFWPGALTMVLPRRTDAHLAPAVTAGLASVALRCPAHPIMHQVLHESGLALAAPSANKSGGVSPTQAEHVAASLQDKVDVILDGGVCAQGIESTIVALRADGSWQVLRPGPITDQDLACVLAVAATNSIGVQAGKIEAPGQLASHYAPGKPVRLNANQAEDDEFFIGFGALEGHRNLSAGGDLQEAAMHLYDALHEASKASFARICVAPIPDEGIGRAINDRLGRAAA